MEKPNPFQHTVSKVFYINHSISRSGRRGRMRRHMRENMASRGRDTGKSCSQGGRCQISLPMAGTACFLAPGTAGILAMLRSTISVCCQYSRVVTNLLPRILTHHHPAPVFLQTRQQNPQICFLDPIGSGAARRAAAVRGTPAHVSLSSNTGTGTPFAVRPGSYPCAKRSGRELLISATPHTWRWTRVANSLFPASSSHPRHTESDC